MPSNASASHADVVQNKFNLFLASQQRLLDSWLPPRTPDEAARAARSEEELEREEAEIFRPVPTTLGVGAKLPSDSSLYDRSKARGTGMSQDRLRQKLLGKGRSTSTPISNPEPRHPPSGKQSAGRKGPIGKEGAEDDDDDEPGRSSLGRAKKRKRAGALQAEAGSDHQSENTPEHAVPDVPKQVDEGSGDDALPSATAALSRQRRGNFLDEMLREKALKKKTSKKKKKNRNHEGT